MNDKAVTKDDKRIASLLGIMDELSQTMEDIARNSRPALEGEQYLTDREVSKLLKISRRCLQDYRTEGKIPFYRIGGKILYRAGDIERFLGERYENRQGKGFTGI